MLNTNNINTLLFINNDFNNISIPHFAQFNNIIPTISMIITQTKSNSFI